MNNTTKIKTKLVHCLWLFMAFFCVFFSGAIKKVLQLQAYEKIAAVTHTDSDIPRSSTQNIKDGYREKHEVQALVATAQQAPSFPSGAYLARTVQELYYFKQYTGRSSGLSYHNHQSEVPKASVHYLFLRRINV